MDEPGIAMNLAEFVLRMKVPNYQDFFNGNAGGIVTLLHREARIITYGGFKKQVNSAYPTEQISLLGIVRDNPDSTFHEINRRAVNQYNFASGASYASRYAKVLEDFAAIGAIEVPGGNVDLFPGTLSNSMIEKNNAVRFRLYGDGLERIEVVSIVTTGVVNRERFAEYFSLR